MTEGELAAIMEDALKRVPIGSRWQHVVSGKYIVLGIEVREEDLSPSVSYRRASYRVSPPTVWNRKLDVFLERFTRIL